MLENSYKQYQELGFILQKSTKHKKHAHRKGSYQERENEPYEHTATGYVGIIPKGIIIVDNDKYQDEGASMSKFIKDNNLTAEPFATTPSGGEHYAFYNQYPDKLVGSTKDYPALDIYAGYQSVIPIVGTTVENKQGELASYAWADEFDEFIVNAWNDSFLTTLNMRDRGEKRDNDYDEMGLTLATKEDNMPEEEVDSLLNTLPPELEYDVWLQVGMCLYDRYEGGEEGLNKFLVFGEQSDKNNEDFTRSKWDNGHLIPNQMDYRTLRSIVGEVKNIELDNLIKKIDSLEDIHAIAEKIESGEIPLRKRGMDRKTVAEEIGQKLNKKIKEHNTANPKDTWKVTQASTFRNNFLKATVEEVDNPSGCSVFLCQNKYVVKCGDRIVEEVGAQALGTMLKSFKYTKEEIDALKNNLVAISDVKVLPEYTLDKNIEFSVEDIDATKLPYLMVRKNPLIDVKGYIHDEEIINDFAYEIWNGKLDDIIELIALTVKLKEQKLNRLMLVAPSNSGKSEIFTMLGFQKITMNRLLNGMRGNKGVGGGVISGIKNSALLLIDEANTPLEAEIKDLDKEIHIDQFGSGGTQILPLHFTALTSTHKTATRNNSDELYNRFLQVELRKDEMKHTIMGSEVFLRDSDRYTQVTKSYILGRFMETIYDDKGKDELRALQAKYRLPTNNDLDVLLYDIAELFIKQTKASARDDGEVILKGDKYYYKKKHDVKEFFTDHLQEIPAIDIGKYEELLTDHFIGNKRTSVRINGTPKKVYNVTLLPYTTDEDELIISHFDEL